MSSLEGAQPIPAHVARGRITTIACLGAIGVSLFALALIPMSFLGRIPEPGASVAASAIILFPAITGLVVALQRPQNNVGWLLIGHAWLVTVVFGSEVLASVFLAAGDIQPAAWAKTISDACWPLLFVGPVLLAIEFPGDRPTTRRQRKTRRLAVGSALILILGGLLSGEPLPAPFDQLENPLPHLPSSISWLPFVALFGLLGAMIEAVAMARLNLKVAHGDRRLQMLWFAWAALTIPATVIVCIVEGSLLGGPETATFAALTLMGTVLPVAIAVGILRYQLLDIEVVINRTLVYGLLTFLVAGIYAAFVALAGHAIGDRTIAGIAAAITVAVAVQPAHSRIQRRVDRWVFGDRVDPYAALKRLDAQLLTSPTPDAAVHAVVETVALALKLPYAAVLIEDGKDEIAVAMYGRLGRGEIERRDLAHRGEAVGALIVEVPRGRRLDPTDARFLDELASHVGAAVHSVRLTSALQQSRKEIVTAREEERRRLRRDLHDGVGPNLAAMSLQLGSLREHVDETNAELVDRLGSQVQDAINDIRRLVYDLRPPALDQYGLVPALTEQASRISQRSSEFTVTGPGEMTAFSAAVEVAAYRIALEAMTNAARHGAANHCAVTIALKGNDLVVSIEDDGCGIDPEASHGVGIRSMRERVDELGGSLEIDRPSGGGTRVVASLPVEQ